MKELIQKNVKIFLKNKFVFQGKVLSQDTQFLEIFDEISQKSRIISLSEISNIEVTNEKKMEVIENDSRFSNPKEN